MKNVVAALVLAVLALPAAAQIYKWKDAAGNTHYSDQPPPAGAKAKAIETKELPVSSLQTKKAETPAASEAKPADKKAEAAPAEAAKKPMDPAKCKTAQERRAYLDNQKLFKTINEKGEVEFMTPEKRAAENARVNKEIEENCGP
ncbi:DUF4124 domain-containing protein [Chitinibacteraceae bacterium HSL-7]